MNPTETQPIFCKRLKYGTPDDVTVILGIITFEDDKFLEFKTGHRTYRISKSMILALEDTDRIFRDENGGGDDRN